eukprot:gnl/TRDRNA2_/TRDRNA2_98564_c0_seq1.p1 gnl/TRDRNA2_/TRDRNA2_98564_c0~~gnl/TRDRNA2_/TRDRNA2_98564_c0_seq1.p1  ORF type:complete len:137 (-),score=4.37 gnl/TRDRNA2_/TRDRNA2_98564_c0_seq1:199-609(-)
MANAHAALVRSYELNSGKRCSDTLASCAKNSLSKCFIVPKAHAVLTRPCTLNSPACHAAAFATTAITARTFSFNCLTPTVAYAHAKLARPCVLNIRTRRSTSLASAVWNRESCCWMVVEAHAKLVRFYTVKLPNRY